MAGVRGQPTLTDGDVVLRPLVEADLDAARRGHDDRIRRWFDAATPSGEDYAHQLKETLAAVAADRRTVGFAVERGGAVAGTVAVRREGAEWGRLSWALFAGHRGRGTMTRALRLAVQHAFADLGLHRVVAYVDTDDMRALRVASRAGLRREGIVRGHDYRDGRLQDTVILGRLRDDPEPVSRDGFIAMLNANLPTKRIIAQGVLRDGAGRVLLAELTYKPEWDLPGGVVERGESPRQGLMREVLEETGLRLEPRRLLTVNWLSPWRGWDDACAFVFDLGTHEASILDETVLQPTEIVALHWCDEAAVAEHATAVTQGLLSFLAEHPDGTPYLEAGVPPTGP